MLLKTKISTPRYEETISFYRELFGMHEVERWAGDDDTGVILSFTSQDHASLLEIYLCEQPHDFAGLSLQFRVEDLAAFVAALPASLERQGPRPRPWGSTYLYLVDPNGIQVIVYEGGF